MCLRIYENIEKSKVCYKLTHPTAECIWISKEIGKFIKRPEQRFAFQRSTIDIAGPLFWRLSYLTLQPCLQFTLIDTRSIFTIEPGSLPSGTKSASPAYRYIPKKAPFQRLLTSSSDPEFSALTSLPDSFTRSDFFIVIFTILKQELDK